MKPTLCVSKLDAIAKDQQIPNSARAGESMSTLISDHISSQCESASVSCCVVRVAPGKHLPQGEPTRHETEKTRKGQRKYKHKKEINLPRRASKRLAGIEVDPVPELKTRNRARRVAVNQSGEGKVITNVDGRPFCSPNDAAKQFDAVERGLEISNKFDCTTNKMESTLEVRGIDKDQECFSFSPLDNQPATKELMSVLKNGEKGDGKLDYSLDFPLGELLTDPCIAFAIQTLTGVTFDAYENTQSRSEFMNTERSETLAAAEGHNKKIKVQNIRDEQEGCHVFSPQENLVISNESATVAEIDFTDKANLNSGPPSEMPLDMSWMDPCIEFAIKTLTDSGAIPCDTDPNSGNFFPRQLGSSNAQGHCGMAL